MQKERNKNIPASYLVLLKNNKILLLKRFNTGYEDGNYSMISGHVDSGENFTQCVIREAEEEAGIIVKPENLEMIHTMHRITGVPNDNERIEMFFICRKWEGKIINKEPDKCDDLSWFDLNNLPDNIIPYVRQAIEGIKNKIQYSEHGWM